MGWIVSLLFFYKDGVGIKYPTMVDMPLNTQTNQTFPAGRMRHRAIFKMLYSWFEISILLLDWLFYQG